MQGGDTDIIMEKCNGGGDTNIIKEKCNGVVGKNKNLTDKQNGHVDSNNKLPDKCNGQNSVMIEKPTSLDQNNILKEKCNNFGDNIIITEKCTGGEEINDNNISQESWDQTCKKNNDLMDDNNQWNENIR